MLVIFAVLFLSDTALHMLSAFYPVRNVFRILLYSACCFLLSPLAVGLLYYYSDLFRSAHGDGPSHVPPSVVFSPYASLSSVVRAWWQTFTGMLLTAMIPASLTPLYFAERLLPSGQSLLPRILLWLGSTVLFLSVLFLNARLMPAVYLSAVHPEYTFSAVLRRAWTGSRSAALTGVLLQLGIWAVTVLSLLLTAGIVYFIYVLPIAFFTYIGYCHDISLHSEMF